VRLVGFIIRKFVTMHGNMSVKFYDSICSEEGFGLPFPKGGVTVFSL
jgi:hypothetical protein